MLKIFRILSLFEGVSYLVILSVTLDFISRDYVQFLGKGHGVLFMLYFLLSLVVSHKRGWSVVTWVLVFLAAVVPFAFILVEVFLRKDNIKENRDKQDD